MTSHWNGSDVDCFKIPLKNLDMLFQTELIRSKESDTLYMVLRKMRDQRVSVIEIEAKEGGHTVALCFLNDLIYLLRQNDYHYYLGLPVMVFLKELNSYDDNIAGDDSSDFNQD